MLQVIWPSKSGGLKDLVCSPSVETRTFLLAEEGSAEPTMFVSSAFEEAQRKLGQSVEGVVSRFKSLPTHLQLMLGIGGGVGASLTFYYLSKLAKKATLRLLLSRRGWMYRRDASFRTKLKFAVIKILCGKRPKLFELQEYLPSLPVPSLEQTMYKFYESMKPLLSNEELKELQRMMLDFQKRGGVGFKIQMALLFRRYTTVNWLEEFWLNYVYLMSRDRLPVNSNWYGMDADPEMTPGFLAVTKKEDQKPRTGMKRSNSLSNLNLSGVQRAALWVVGCLQFKKTLETEVSINLRCTCHPNILIGDRS